MKNLNFIDLFAGAGGLSEGFIQAGYNPIAHIEIDAHACSTIQTRNIFHYLKKENQLDDYYAYLKEEITKDDLLEKYTIPQNVLNYAIGDDNEHIFEQVDKLAQGAEVDLIIGGPPCQAYSMIGRHRVNQLEEDDPRNLLYKQYARFLKRYKPKIFIFENVLGLKSAEKGKYFANIQKYFKSIGYNLECRVQNAADFGVLQSRKRLILIGWRKGVEFEYPDFNKVQHDWTVQDILKDLKKLKPGEQNNITQYAQETTEYLEKFQLRNGVDFVTQHLARPHNERDLKIYKIAIKKWLDKAERLSYPDLPSKLKTHKNEKSFTDRFKVVDINGLSHTMVAHIAKDGHYYIYPDKKQVRSLSVREAARIQSFPDDFFFEGGRSAAFRQIGNAVPPLMSLEIAKKIKEQINE